jgi:uncharacterized protein YecE (DUF72 family)
MAAPIHIGTSGWEYADWRGRFYPAELARDRWLEFYAERFGTVELNASFYRLPDAETFAGWGRRVPAPFVFAVKASRYLTHVRRLREPREPLDRLWSRARRLDRHLGPVLYQLPPRWLPNLERLEAFLAAVPAGHPQADSAVSLCLHDMPGSEPSPDPVGSMVYVRFHGAGERYGGAYPSQRLSAWADRMVDWSRAGLPVWAYFNNDRGGHAVVDADRLRRMIARR